MDKLHAVQSNPQYQGVWQSYQLHFGLYKGPTYEAELEAGGVALAAYEKDYK